MRVRVCACACLRKHLPSAQAWQKLGSDSLFGSKMSLRRSLWAQLLGLGGSSSSDEDNGEPQQSAAPAEHAGARELRPVSATHAAAASRSVASTTAPADLVHYAVRKGDTWAGVALRHGMTVRRALVAIVCAADRRSRSHSSRSCCAPIAPRAVARPPLASACGCALCLLAIAAA